MKIAILGRQPKLGLAELISLYGSDVSPLTDLTARVSATKIDFERLGGTVKLAHPLKPVQAGNLAEFFQQLTPEIAAHLSKSSGKQTIGLSVYGKKLDQREVFRQLLSLKKQLGTQGISARVVTADNQIISAAQIIHNRMLDHGADIILVWQDEQVWSAITEQVQDIERYGRRDYDRPARSAKVGMLPPKLAQIMINLANPPSGSTILDPFCGTGVVLQEAALMGFKVYGNDIEPELTDMTRRNLDWLAREFNTSVKAGLAVGDAKTQQWKVGIDAVVTESYLGPNLIKPPSDLELATLVRDSSSLALAFLSNLRGQVKAGIPVAITLPAWKHAKGWKRLAIIDQITALGYTLEQFLPVTQSDLVYFRPDQIVARELVVLRSK